MIEFERIVHSETWAHFTYNFDATIITKKNPDKIEDQFIQMFLKPILNSVLQNEVFVVVFLLQKAMFYTRLLHIEILYIGKLLLYHVIRHNYFQNLIQLQFITRSRLPNNSCWVLAVPIHLRCEKTNFFLLDTYNFKLVIQFIKNVSTGAHDSVSL